MAPQYTASQPNREHTTLKLTQGFLRQGLERLGGTVACARWDAGVSEGGSIGFAPCPHGPPQGSWHPRGSTARDADIKSNVCAHPPISRLYSQVVDRSHGQCPLTVGFSHVGHLH